MRWPRWLLLVAAFCVVGVAALFVGTIRGSPGALWRALLGEGDPTLVSVVRTLRLPRTLLGALVGAALGISGGALQGLLRNPLAEPYLLGVSGGAAVGAALAVVGGVAFALVPLAAFAGAAVAVMLALFVARAAGARRDPRTLLMAGVVVGAFANATVMVLLANAPANVMRGALWWMMGSVGDATVGTVGILGLYVLPGALALFAMGRHLDAMALGEEAAAGLGVNVDAITVRVFATAALVAAATVAAAGLVGFVGLIVPHVVRALGARRHRALFAGSALAGGALVMAADAIARVALPPAELPLGAVTALLGVPFFLAKLRRLT